MYVTPVDRVAQQARERLLAQAALDVAAVAAGADAEPGHAHAGPSQRDEVRRTRGGAAAAPGDQRGADGGRGLADELPTTEAVLTHALLPSPPAPRPADPVTVIPGRGLTCLFKASRPPATAARPADGPVYADNRIAMVATMTGPMTTPMSPKAGCRRAG